MSQAAIQELDPKVKDLVSEVTDLLLVQGITVGQMHNLEDRDYEAVYSLGYNLYNQAKYEEALKAFAFLTFFNHLERRYLKALASCQQMLGRYDSAIQTYAIASILDATDPEPTLHTAECLIALGMLPEAREALELVVEESAGQDKYKALNERASVMLDLLAEKTAALSPAAGGE